MLQVAEDKGALLQDGRYGSQVCRCVAPAASGADDREKRHQEIQPCVAIRYRRTVLRADMVSMKSGLLFFFLPNMQLFYQCL